MRLRKGRGRKSTLVDGWLEGPWYLVTFYLLTKLCNGWVAWVWTLTYRVDGWDEIKIGKANISPRLLLYNIVPICSDVYASNRKFVYKYLIVLRPKNVYFDRFNGLQNNFVTGQIIVLHSMILICLFRWCILVRRYRPSASKSIEIAIANVSNKLWEYFVQRFHIHVPIFY